MNVQVYWPNHDGKRPTWTWVPARVTLTREESWAVPPGCVRVALAGRRGNYGHYNIPLDRVRKEIK
jgi:hypothetical protein